MRSTPPSARSAGRMPRSAAVAWARWAAAEPGRDASLRRGSPRARKRLAKGQRLRRRVVAAPRRADRVTQHRIVMTARTGGGVVTVRSGGRRE